jgi:hypothetical protein
VWGGAAGPGTGWAAPVAVGKRLADGGGVAVALGIGNRRQQIIPDRRAASPPCAARAGQPSTLPFAACATEAVAAKSTIAAGPPAAPGPRLARIRLAHLRRPAGPSERSRFRFGHDTLPGRVLRHPVQGPDQPSDHLGRVVFRKSVILRQLTDPCEQLARSSTGVMLLLSPRSVSSVAGQPDSRATLAPTAMHHKARSSSHHMSRTHARARRTGPILP